ncbi:MAG: hypothetical protein HWD84_09295 [Flavobacteriaceae bacterium]|nr:hypothetical protein [Flavobacteriaceae bacterium]
MKTLILKTNHKGLIFLHVLFLFFNSMQVNAQNRLDRDLTEKDLIGAWEIDFNKTVAAIESGKKRIYNELDGEMKEAFDKAYEGRVLTFHESGLFKQTSKNGHSIDGSWILNKKGRVLTLKIRGAGTKSFDIDHFENNELILIIQGKKSDSSLLVSKWIVVKK